jgi:hypothetical protein
MDWVAAGREPVGGHLYVSSQKSVKCNFRGKCGDFEAETTKNGITLELHF